jgi:hypothetical protein
MSEWGDGGRKRSRVPSCARHVRMRESRWPFAPMAGASGWAMLVLLATAAACSGKGTTPCTDANVELIQASNYDQSCTVDADCVSIAVGDACYPCLVICQVGGAINRGALSSYRSDISKTIGAGETSGVECSCPSWSGPCCRGGICNAGLECEGPPADASAE